MGLKKSKPGDDLNGLLRLIMLLMIVLLVIDILEAVTTFFVRNALHELHVLDVALILLSITLAGIVVRRWKEAGQQRALSQYKQTIETLRENESKLRAIIDHTSDIIYIKDTEGRYILANPAAAHMLGKNCPEEIIGKTDNELFDETSSQKNREIDREILTSQTIRTFEKSRILGGVTRHLSTIKFVYQPDEGKPRGVVGISRDITLLKQAEQQRLELEREKERIKIMANFMQDVAHDFRTPLAVINTSLYLLLKTDDSQRKLDHANSIQAQIAHLEKVLNGLMTLTRLDAVNSLPRAPVNLNLLVRDVCAHLADQAKQKQIRLSLDLDDTLPLVPASDADLRQVLLELGHNAISYTPEGKDITVRTYRESEQAVIQVRDTGSGIPEAELPLIFGRFYRTDKARSIETGGVGLGLPIAQKIIDLHHGSLTITSVPGEGTTCTIRLPVT